MHLTASSTCPTLQIDTVLDTNGAGDTFATGAAVCNSPRRCAACLAVAVRALLSSRSLTQLSTLPPRLPPSLLQPT